MRLAQSSEDRIAACRLRFRVFNIELGEGLESSYETGIDTDQFDDVCEHLIVEDKRKTILRGGSWALIACRPGRRRRAITGTTPSRNSTCAPYELLRPGILELGRASIDREHRTPEVLTLLWRGIAQYATDMGLRYLIGCSSLTSKDPAEGWQLYRQLDHYRVSSGVRDVRRPKLTPVPSSREAKRTAVILPQGIEFWRWRDSRSILFAERAQVKVPEAYSRPIWPLGRGSPRRRRGIANSAPSIS